MVHLLYAIGWDELNLIQERAVNRGLARRKEEKIEYLGIDEKSFKKNRVFVSVLNDLDRGRVLDIDESLPKADIVHDKFHISKYFNEALATIWKSERKDNEVLNKTKMLWLTNPEFSIPYFSNSCKNFPVYLFLKFQ